MATSSMSILRCMQDPDGWSTMRIMQYGSWGFGLSGGVVGSTFEASQSTVDRVLLQYWCLERDQITACSDKIV
jgi:hypothetical protein